MPYDEKELEREWTRLATLAAEEFAAEIGRDETDEISDSSGQLEFGEW